MINSPSVSRRTVILFYVVIAVAILIWIRRIAVAWRFTLRYDDAYMFYRYALQMRAGYGFAWNAAGGPTYGPTSLLWTATVFVLSLLPLPAGKALLLGSWVFGGVAVGVMAWSVSAAAASPLMRSKVRVAGMIGLPLMLLTPYWLNSVTGMDTMESLAMNALAAGMIVLWTQKATVARATMAGLCGLLAFLARPDSALPILLLALLADRLLVKREERGRTLWVLMGVLFAGIGLDLLLCRLYFGTAVPLSFYVKAGGGYAGYAADWHPALSGFRFLRATAVFLLPMIVLIDRRHWRLAVTFLVPVVVAFGYYMTLVLQIMGTPSRFYAPLFPFVVIPAMLMLDEAILSRPTGLEKRASMRLGTIAVLLLAAGPMRTVQHVDAMLLGHKVVYREPMRATGAGKPLAPMEWFEAQKALTDELLAKLPARASVASTEVGYMGAMAPQVDVIDLAGLNNTEISRHGFSAQRVFAMRPDIIWMPMREYSYMCGIVYSAPELLRDYDVWDGAFTYGLAVRKDSPYRKQIDEVFKPAMAKFYPGVETKDYLIRSVEWNREPYRWPN